MFERTFQVLLMKRSHRNILEGMKRRAHFLARGFRQLIGEMWSRRASLPKPPEAKIIWGEGTCLFFFFGVFIQSAHTLL
jgi:hypothetical protein